MLHRLTEVGWYGRVGSTIIAYKIGLEPHLGLSMKLHTIQLLNRCVPIICSLTMMRTAGTHRLKLHPIQLLKPRGLSMMREHFKR